MDQTGLLGVLADKSQVMKMSSFKDPWGPDYTRSDDYLDLNHLCSPRKVISCPLCSHCDKRNLCIALSCCNLFQPVLFFWNEYLRLIVLGNSFIYHKIWLMCVFLWAVRDVTKTEQKSFEKVQQKISFSSGRPSPEYATHMCCSENRHYQRRSLLLFFPLIIFILE